MKLKRVLAVAMAVSLFSTPVFADHLKARKGHGDSATKVEKRLVELGATEREARSQVNSLTQSEVAYFNADLSRVQVVGAGQDLWAGQSDNLWYETVLGIVATVGSIVGIVFALNNNE